MLDTDPRKQRAEKFFKESKEYLAGITEKLCTSCLLIKNINNFTTCKRNEIRELISWCRDCKKLKESVDYIKRKTEGLVPRDKDGVALIVVNRGSKIHIRRARRYHKVKRDRYNPQDWPFFLRISMRSADLEKKQEFNLRDSDIAEMVIGKACTYCDKQYARMTLDRIDNSLGHQYGNVQVSCGFCNYFRGDLPYSIWLELVPIIKKLSNSGKLETYVNIKSANKAFMAEPYLPQNKGS